MAKARHDPAALRAILARVEAAGGADRGVDGKIREALIGPVVWMPLSGPQIGTPPYTDVPAYTASLDAAVALVDRLCPVKRLEMGIYPSGHVATLRWYPGGLRGDPFVDAVGESRATPALALCAALLRALIARVEEPAHADR